MGEKWCTTLDEGNREKLGIVSKGRFKNLGFFIYFSLIKFLQLCHVVFVVLLINCLS